MRLATNVWHGQTYAKGTVVERCDPPPGSKATPGWFWVRVASGIDEGRLIQALDAELEA